MKFERNSPNKLSKDLISSLDQKMVDDHVRAIVLIHNPVTVSTALPVQIPEKMLVKSMEYVPRFPD